MASRTSRAASPEGTTEWGPLARAMIWFLQSSLLGAAAVVALQMRNGGTIALGVSLAASFLSVYLLFRQVNALVEQKLDG